jgi:UDP:flavonoid glycosyltransferase YjiC (YdhE family)
VHITILALGSRGDVQPFVALALALCARGHTANIAAPEDYAGLVTGYGIPFQPLGGLIREQMDMPRVAKMLDGAGNPLRFAAETLPQVQPLVTRLVDDAWAATDPSATTGDSALALLASTLGAIPALTIAEGRGIPLFVAHFHPFTQTSAAQHVNFPAVPPSLPFAARIQPAYYRLSHFLGAHGLWQLLRPSLNRARRRLGLPSLSPAALVTRVRALDGAALYGYSRLLAPLPPGAPPGLPVTGFWLLAHPPSWQPDARLQRFLAEGPPPVYVGFGSNLTGTAPDALTALYAAALDRCGLRGLFYGGWGDFGNIPLPPTILRVDGIPHDWLFPQMAAVVHHGGAGSTSAALAAGVPAVAMPFLGDQFFWAQQIYAQGCGPSPIVRQGLTVERLAANLADLTANRAYRTRARELGAALRAEDGPAAAADWLARKLAPYRFEDV